MFLARADSAALEMLARAIARHREAAQHLADEGVVLTLPNGCSALNPWRKVEKESAALVSDLLHAFGLTPAARARVTPAVDDAKDPDPLADFLNDNGNN